MLLGAELHRQKPGHRGAGLSALQSPLRCEKNCQDADSLREVGGVFAAAVHAGGVVVELLEKALARMVERTEIVLAIRIVIFGEAIEVPYLAQDGGLVGGRARGDAGRHYDLAGDTAAKRRNAETM
jgi:hypothetical protein